MATSVIDLHIQVVVVASSPSGSFIELLLILGVLESPLLIIVCVAHSVFGSSGMPYLFLHVLAFLDQILHGLLLFFAVSFVYLLLSKL